MTNATHVMVHPKHSMMVAGKMQRIEKGTELALTRKQAEKLGKKVKLICNDEPLDVTGAESQLEELKKLATEAIDDAEKRAAIAEGEAVGANNRADEAESKLEDAEKEIIALKEKLEAKPKEPKAKG